MKFTKIALACSFALTAMSAQAAPGDVGAIPAATAVPESNIIFFSGASAPDAFLQTVATSMFQPGFTFITGTGDTSTNYRAFVGLASATNPIPGIAAGTQLILIKRSQGGSVWGVGPVAQGNNIRTLDVKSAACIQGANTTTYTCPIVGTDPVGAANGSGGRVTDIGVSDIEPAMFKAPFNTENGAPQLTNTELANLISLPVNQLMMGIVATNAVPATTHFSRSQYGAALAGKYENWDQIENTTAGDTMVVCRRVNGSGTQTSYNWMFSGFPCNVTTLGYLSNSPAVIADGFAWDAGLNATKAGTPADPFIIDPSNGFAIIENSSSGDVRNCLSSAYYGVDHITQGDSGKFYKVLFSSVAGTPVSASVVTAGAGAPALVRGGPSKAIGVLSVDSFGAANLAFGYKPLQTNNTTPYTYTFTDTSASPLTASGFSFRSLDGAGVFNAAANVQAFTAGPGTGIAPSKSNLVNGKYDFVVELTMQRRPTLSALKTSFFTELRKRLGAVNNTTNPAFATLPDVASYTSPASNAAVVSKFSRSGNTCAPLVSFPSL